MYLLQNQARDMESGSRKAALYLHYIVPLSVFLYYISASAHSVCTLKVARFKFSRSSKIAVVVAHALTALGYTIEASIVVFQIFKSPGAFSDKDYNIYALSQGLVWVVLTASVFESDDHQWYPYIGSWILTSAAEIVLTTLSLTTSTPSNNLEALQIACQAFRILTISALLASYFVCAQTASEHVDEETTPLLNPEEETHPKFSSTLGIGIANADENIVSAIAAEEAGKRIKKDKEKLEKLNSRLAQEGNWFSYIRGYSIFVPHIWPSKKPVLMLNMLSVAVCMAVERGLNILVPRQLGIVVNSLGKKDSSSFMALGLYVFLTWLNSYSGIPGLRSLLWLPVDGNARMSLFTASYNQIMELSCDFHDEKQSGELYTAMSQGYSLLDLLDTVLLEFFPVWVDVVLALVYFKLLFDSYLVLIGIATMVAYFWASIYLANIQLKVQRLANASSRRRYQVMYATMGEWKTVTYFNRIPHAKQMYHASVSFWRQLWSKIRLLFYFSNGVGQTILDVGSFAAYFFGAYHVVFGSKDVGTFVTLVTFWQGFTGPMTSLARVHKHVLDDLVDAEELLALYRKIPSVQDGANELNITEARVEFDTISFDYTGKKSIISNVSFVAEPGKTIALIGETGAGKSTLLKLLFRFYDVTAGAIYIDGQDIRNVTLESLRERIGVVPQDASLFNDTIIANLRYAKLDATDEEIYDACRAAAIHEKILEFPDGYMSKVGEKGVKLSGGELQRIAIARAILKDPKLILLDEATSSVDNETEAQIQEGLRKLCNGRTTLIVAHRLSTIMEADLILVLKNGAIVEQGPPHELLKQRGKYYHLWSKQLGLADVARCSDRSDTLIDTSATASLSGDADEVESTFQNHVDVSKAKGSPRKASATSDDSEALDDPISIRPPEGVTNKGYGTLDRPSGRGSGDETSEEPEANSINSTGYEQNGSEDDHGQGQKDKQSTR